MVNMRFNTVIPARLKPYFYAEIGSFEQEFTLKNFRKAWHHLERAHVIGQAYPFEHSYAHWKMLFFGFKIKNTKEIVGQIPRLLVGGIKSFVGKIPVGNTGGANVPPLKPLPVEPDIQHIFRKAGLKD